MAYANSQRLHGFGLSARLHEIASTLRDARMARRTYRQTFNELSHLNNRELNDLGICRSEIRGIAYEAAYGQAR